MIQEKTVFNEVVEEVLTLRNALHKHVDNLSLDQLFLLAELCNENLSMTHIAKLLGTSTASATGLTDRLVVNGYLQKYHCMNDRRKVMAQPTAKAIRLVESVRDLFETSFKNKCIGFME